MDILIARVWPAARRVGAWLLESGSAGKLAIAVGADAVGFALAYASANAPLIGLDCLAATLVLGLVGAASLFWSVASSLLETAAVNRSTARKVTLVFIAFGLLIATVFGPGGARLDETAWLFVAAALVGVGLLTTGRVLHRLAWMSWGLVCARVRP